jgi:hypothetical protein
VEFKEVVSVGRTCERLLVVRNTAPQDRWLEAYQLFNTPSCFSGWTWQRMCVRACVRVNRAGEVRACVRVNRAGV